MSKPEVFQKTRICRAERTATFRTRSGEVSLILLALGVSTLETRAQGTGETKEDKDKKDVSQLSVEELMNLKVGTVYAYSVTGRCPITLNHDYERRYSRPSRGFAPNSDLHPETIKTTEVVFARYFWQQVSLSASGFYNWIGNLISQATPSNGLQFEFGVKRLSGWQGRVSDTLQESRNPLDSNPLSNSPRHLAKVNLIGRWLQTELLASLRGRESAGLYSLGRTDISNGIDQLGFL